MSHFIFLLGSSFECQGTNVHFSHCELRVYSNAVKQGELLQGVSIANIDRERVNFQVQDIYISSK